jgi:hypothetical protein
VQNADEWDIVEPRADSLIESLRAFGYSPETAIADLLDNSLYAKAHAVAVHFEWAGRDSFVAVTDDGDGMSESGLLAAMRPGSLSPLDGRQASDLGRFGLGLKTASFSQARELTVLTRQAPGTDLVARRWDLDTVAATKQWRLLRSAPELLPTGAFKPVGKGTTVYWTKCDRLVGDVESTDTVAHKRFLETIDRVRQHLALTFHRFLSGRGRVRIKVNGQDVPVIDPFLSAHPSTLGLDNERLPLLGQVIEVQPYVLPHRSKLGAADLDLATGAASWNQQQGFYVYRGRRLLVAGDWLNLGFAKEEHAKLARIRVDFPPELDHEWQIDVKKSTARPPRPLIPDLRRIASATRRSAEDVYRHRGKLMLQHSAQPFVLSWQEVKRRDGSRAYRVNRRHPLVEQVLQNAGSARKDIERLLRFVEETVPTTLIGIGIAATLDNQPIPFQDGEKEILEMLRYVHTRMIADGVKSADALRVLSAADPFNAHLDVVQAFAESI